MKCVFLLIIVAAIVIPNAFGEDLAKTSPAPAPAGKPAEHDPATECHMCGGTAAPCTKEMIEKAPAAPAMCDAETGACGFTGPVATPEGKCFTTDAAALVGTDCMKYDATKGCICTAGTGTKHCTALPKAEETPPATGGPGGDTPAATGGPGGDTPAATAGPDGGGGTGDSGAGSLGGGGLTWILGAALASMGVIQLLHNL